MPSTKSAASRLAQLVEANIIATHAYQVLLAVRSGKGDPKCFSPCSLSTRALESLVRHQASLLASDTIEIDAWARGKRSRFSPARDLKPILASPLNLSRRLPVNVLTAWLAKACPPRRAARVPAVHRRAIAGLYQICFESDRDGTLLWQLMHFYRALGLATYPAQFGLLDGDSEFLALGRALAPLSCDAPFADSPRTPAGWRIVSTKIANWGDKHDHVRDNFTMALDLLDEPDIRVLLPRIRKMPRRKIAVIGHSFTMHSHWASAGSFVSTVNAVFQMENPDVVIRQWHSGGLTAVRAFNNYFRDALRWKPDEVLFAFALRTDEDIERLREMTARFIAAGAKVTIFDNLRDPSEDAARNAVGPRVARKTGLTIIQVGRLIASAPDKRTFLCLDKIHMTQSYHRLMAREWLKFLLGARRPHLS